MEFTTLLRQLRPRPDVLGKFPRIAAKAWAMKQGDSEKDLRKLQSRLNERKRRRHRLVESLLDGTLSRETFSSLRFTSWTCPGLGRLQEQNSANGFKVCSSMAVWRTCRRLVFRTALSLPFTECWQQSKRKKTCWRPRRDSNPCYRRERAVS
jgi:hypothetical protein